MCESASSGLRILIEALQNAQGADPGASHVMEVSMFVVLLEYVQPLTAIDAYIEEHRRFLDRHYAAGHFIASGPRRPRTGGVILAHRLTREELDLVLAEDPFRRESLAQYRVIEFSPSKSAPDLDALLTAPN